ncbi:MAG: hypothetical protein K1X50_20030 [Candidatus Promineofilum sp.]|mgnify:FL=1|nr:hypothetical protein [Promineifilum sp.]MCW5865015.1 hypothetical protein [Anaerolineae bacterium]
MSANAPRPILLHADQEHSGLRLAVFLGLFAGLLLGFGVVLLALNAFAPPAIRDYRYFLSCVGAFPVALLLIWGLERLLKRVWHSGLSLELTPYGIVVHDQLGAKGQVPGSREERSSLAPNPYPLAPTLSWSAHFTQLNWYFRVSGYPRAGRERRVANKWLCLGTELNQDGTRLNVFTFMPPERAAAWIDNPRAAFHRLNPADVYETSPRARLGPPGRPTIPNQVLHSKDGRYWLAERRRWEQGMELTPADFTTFMDAALAHARPGPAAGAESPIVSTH